MKRFFALFKDESRSVQERLFLLVASIAMVALFVVFVIGVALKESVLDLVTIGVSFVVFAAMAVPAVKYRMTSFFAPIVSALIIFVLLPVTYFTGGGVYGGSPLWFLFCTVFISLIVTGRIKYVLLVCSGVVAAACYYISYMFPSLVSGHMFRMIYVDSFVSLLFASFLLAVMIGFEVYTLTGEMEKSEEKSRQIDEMNRSQNRFFSSMSHEIRTPINTIIGLNEMILREEDIPEEVAEDAKNIASASRILLSLINDILDMSKIESGKMELAMAPYDVAQLIREVTAMIGVRANEKGLTFEVEVDPTMPAELFSDEVRIKQILINLLNNAIKYTSEGSVSFSVHCRRTGPKQAVVTYSVEDTGMGIRKENIPHLFDAFRREDTEKNRYIEGTGLGLSIVKQLVDLMGGDISVNSVYTKGSTFVVTIGQEISGEAVIGRFDPNEGRGENRQLYHRKFVAPEAKVLIVDDNSANLLVAQKLLRETKLQTETAESGAECLKKTARTHYDVILMDHLMPEMDGIETLHAVRDQIGGQCLDTPVVAMTANAGGEDRVLYRQAGFDGYILKPVDSALLEDTLADLLPREMVREQDEQIRFVADKTVREMRRKVPILVTTDSVCDLPRELLEALKIPVQPYRIFMKDGVFTDGIEAESDVILRYISEKGTSARSEAPTVEEYEQFFSEQLTKAQHIIHISMGKRTGDGFANASEAALAFYNVRVFDSGHLSSGMGMMTLIAKELSESGSTDVLAVLKQLEEKRSKITTSFIMDSTEYLYRSGFVSARMHRICSGLLLHPVVELKDSGMQFGWLFFGRKKSARESYIRYALRHKNTIDTSMLFVTYAGMNASEAERIKDEVLKLVPFESVFVQKASSAISVNCGPNSFGLIFARK